jgi:hypothetical protein
MRDRLLGRRHRRDCRDCPRSHSQKTAIHRPAGRDFTEARAALPSTDPPERETRRSLDSRNTKDGSRLKLEDAIADLLLEVQTHRAKRTYAAYRAMLQDFSDSCPKVYMDRFERKDLMNFTADLKSPLESGTS